MITLNLVERLMMEDPRTISSCLNVIWVLRSLERIGDHSRNMAAHIIYLVSGKTSVIKVSKI
ncbi:MAG: phosphate transport system regulatory protein PhoU [Osedax symbiont Rs1]|nr:MAG: phosphate transport system regulatory protein PhoU [Osedax symbiont Rs1]